MSIDLSDVQLDALLKRLHLANTRRAWRDLVQRAEQEEWGYRDYLTLLVSEEIAHRQQTRVARMVRRARFPFLKTIDDFNFMYQSTVRLSLLGSALAPDFVTEGRCLIFGGKPGRGKTHSTVRRSRWNLYQHPSRCSRRSRFPKSPIPRIVGSPRTS